MKCILINVTYNYILSLHAFWGGDTLYIIMTYRSLLQNEAVSKIHRGRIISPKLTQGLSIFLLVILVYRSGEPSLALGFLCLFLRKVCE